MKVKTINLSNFKGIDNLTIPFEDKSTILFGVNGVGKSTILRSIDLIYANIISGIMSTQKKLAQLEMDDIRVGKTAAQINIEVEFSDGTTRNYSRWISKKMEENTIQKN